MATPQIFGGDAPEVSDAESNVMDRDDIQALLKAEMADAVDYIESEVGPDRALATQYYKGEKFGNEELGRSQVVSTDLRDTVLQVLPSFMRVFMGTERVVEFVPERVDAEDAAKQRTDYINLVFTEDNPGFLTLYAAIKDALIRRYAVLKWWWDDREEVRTETYTGLLEEQLQELADDEEVEDITVEEDGEVEMDAPDIAPDPAMGGPAPAGKVKTFKVVVRRKHKISRARIAVIPGEEFLVNRNARTLQHATIIAHRRAMTRSDLVAMGYTRDFIEEHEGSGAFSFETSPEALARRFQRRTFGNEDHNEDISRVEYTEALLRIDQDGDGIAELHKVCAIGSNYFIAKIEDADEINYAILCPDPEPHELTGQGYMDLVGDLQLINSMILRSTLDSLSLAITPRVEAVEGQTNMDDVLNTEVGGVIRSKAPGMVNPIVLPFVGDSGLRMLDYTGGLREQRGGITRGSQGLDADSLQSTTKMAVAAQFTAAQGRIELIARVFAETGIKDMFMGLQRLIMRHQDVPRTVRLRGKWVDVDPRTWNAPLDVRVNIALGGGMPEERVTRLAAIAAKQELVIQTLGSTSPLVSLGQYRNTLAKMTELSGYNDASQFFGEIPPDYQPPAPPTPPDPAMILAQAQAKDLEAKLEIEHAKVAQQREEMHLLDTRERMKIRANIEIELAKIHSAEGKHTTEQAVNAAVEHARMQADNEARRHEAETDMEARRHEAETAAQAQVDAAAAKGPPSAG